MTTKETSAIGVEEELIIQEKLDDLGIEESVFRFYGDVRGCYSVTNEVMEKVWSRFEGDGKGFVCVEEGEGEVVVIDEKWEGIEREREREEREEREKREKEKEKEKEKGGEGENQEDSESEEDSDDDSSSQDDKSQKDPQKPHHLSIKLPIKHLSVSDKSSNPYLLYLSTLLSSLLFLLLLIRLCSHLCRPSPPSSSSSALNQQSHQQHEPNLAFQQSTLEPDSAKTKSNFEPSLQQLKLEKREENQEDVEEIEHEIE